MFSLRTRICTAVALAGLFVLSGSCDTTATEPEKQVVVEAYLEADTTLPDIRLTQSVGIGEGYDPGRSAVRNASVHVEELDDAGSAVRSVPFEERTPGVYRPIAAVEVQPQTTYELSVTTQEGTEVSATTTVPDPIGIVEAENTEVVYQGAAQPTFTIAPPADTDSDQTVLVLTTTSLLDFENQPTEQLTNQFTPLYANGYDPETDSIASFRTTSSSLLNEENFDRMPTGNIEARLPWLAVAFYGPNEVGVNVIDDNLFDLIRTQQTQQGGPGAGLGPGEIPNVIEHVEGGTGVFGSYARAEQRIVVERPGASSP